MTRQGRGLHRFAVAPTAVAAGKVRFSAVAARQMRRVLRLRPGDRVVAFDGSGAEFTVSLVSLRDDSAVGAVEAGVTRSTEPAIELTLCQALLPRDKFEIVLQKATEVGVSTFVPLMTERSLIPAGALDDRRLERWRRIVSEAAEQAGRTRIPSLSEPASLVSALSDGTSGLVIVAWEREQELSLRQVISRLGRDTSSRRVTLVVGPEGGFVEREIETARELGAATVSLGPRILRAETAGPVLAALTLYEAGDLEPRP